ncbi:hypothetical protein H072_6146 [Dactylellina haptotyla CBS 200.50]|uniref:EF-hand domain-containing protein n=1 Tax=Dactylellina haptotyla (strain CBS 200.50) TaxID=1284197 RepID=S8BXH4_DACHA|nr:hypothetical protein H072_6146 [Dactylellina haptotyla CBS 200.50]
MRTATLLSTLTSAAVVLAHGSAPHRDEPNLEHLDWGTKHMIAEHHFEMFDPESFFIMHDFDQSHTWTHDEILRTYGIHPYKGYLYDDTGHEGNVIPYETREDIVKQIMELMDLDHDSAITMEEFKHAWESGKRLPDFGYGTGHHGDDEYEYEIHHYEKFHGGDNVKEEDLNHPEDIAHFKKHEQDDEEERKWEQEANLKVIEKNIPVKFRIQRPKAH